MATNKETIGNGNSPGRHKDELYIIFGKCEIKGEKGYTDSQCSRKDGFKVGIGGSNGSFPTTHALVQRVI